MWKAYKNIHAVAFNDKFLLPTMLLSKFTIRSARDIDFSVNYKIHDFTSSIAAGC